MTVLTHLGDDFLLLLDVQRALKLGREAVHRAACAHWRAQRASEAPISEQRIPLERRLAVSQRMYTILWYLGTICGDCG